MYGPTGANLGGKTNAYIADYFKNKLFKVKGQKLDAQVMAVAFATYVTNSNLAGGTQATSYGFIVQSNTTGGGTGSATYNVGTSGAALGVANNTVLSIMDILKKTDEMSTSGVLYNGDVFLRNLANTLYDSINNTGDIT